MPGWAARAADGAGTDAEDVLVAIGAGDVAALARLYDDYAPAIYGLASRMLADAEVAAECTETTFARVWAGARDFDPTEGSAESWVIALAHRAIVDRVPEEVPERRPEEPTAAAQSTGLAGLPGTERSAIQDAYFAGHGYRDVAERLAVPADDVLRALRDGMWRLRGHQRG
jgi:RNA polymerase sigma-70 factor (ECF subfamily)